VTVNGLPLPADLLALVAAGRWKRPADPAGFNALFPENAGPHLYGFGLMESETRGLFHPRMQTPTWLGTPDPEHPPGDIDPRLAVLIAGLGLGYDQPIALDYRPSTTRPRVITLRRADDERNRWVTVAGDVLEFADLAGL
jgi:hypothetical protein